MAAIVAGIREQPKEEPPKPEEAKPKGVTAKRQEATYVPVAGRGFDIFISVGHTVRLTTWGGNSFKDLQDLCLSTFECKGLPRGCKLWGAKIFRVHVPYKQPKFIRKIDQIAPGCVVEVVDQTWRSALKLSVLEAEAGQTQPDDARNAWNLLLNKLELFLNEPQSSKPATYWAVFILGLIAVSTVTFVLETLPYIYSTGHSFTVWTAIESFCIAVFTIEILCRFFVAPAKWMFVSDKLNMIDFIAILPFYCELIVSGIEVPGLSVLRVMRLARVFRLFKVSRGSIQVLSDTMTKSAKPLYILLFLTSIAMILFASIMYYAERGRYDEERKVWMRRIGYSCEVPCVERAPWLGCPEAGVWHRQTFEHKTGPRKAECINVDEQSPFESIPASCWWALVTMTTLGYGDLSPISPLGKFVGMVAMMIGILVIALPITVIGSNFATIYEKIGGAIEVEMNSDYEDEVEYGSSESDDDLDVVRGRLDRRVEAAKRGVAADEDQAGSGAEEEMDEEPDAEAKKLAKEKVQIERKERKAFHIPGR